jgi:hypothetical protein
MSAIRVAQTWLRIMGKQVPLWRHREFAPVNEHAAEPGSRTDAQEITYWRNTRSASETTTPSASATSLLNRIVAGVDPSATVTMRSNALSSVSVRFPEMRSVTTSAT